MSVTVIIIIAVLGCVTICTCVVVIFLVWYVKRHSAVERQRDRDYHNQTLHISPSGSGSLNCYFMSINSINSQDVTSKHFPYCFLIAGCI